jgi:hypothetical protein
MSALPPKADIAPQTCDHPNPVGPIIKNRSLERDGTVSARFAMSALPRKRTFGAVRFEPEADVARPRPDADVVRVARDPCSCVSPDGNQYAFALLNSANGVRARIKRSNNNDQFSM